MLAIDNQLTVHDLAPRLATLWQRSGQKILSIASTPELAQATPVFTVQGKYQPQGWTEWTQGFQFGAALLQYDATGDSQFLDLGLKNTMQKMASHVTHFGVHDHGFNNVSTYGNLRRLMLESRIDDALLPACDIALQASAAVQANRWSVTSNGSGYIYSFNGPHSLFCDTIRSLRSLAVGHQLGHAIWSENDVRISLFDRMLHHAQTTAEYNVYYGTGRDHYDVRGRVAHESIFNTNDGNYRCPSTQQGYSPFSTWTRGLAWIMAGYPEQLEYLATRPDNEFDTWSGRDAVVSWMLEAATAACDFFIQNTHRCGIPFWDTGAPGIQQLDAPLEQDADPFNDAEPVDSSAAAIGVQGLLRLGHYLHEIGQAEQGRHYWQAGLTTMRTLLSDRYLNPESHHQGLLLHSIYHRPRNWDYTPPGRAIPCGESCMWGDYHLLEAALYLQRIAQQQPYYTFFGPLQS